MTPEPKVLKGRTERVEHDRSALLLIGPLLTLAGAAMLCLLAGLGGGRSGLRAPVWAAGACALAFLTIGLFSSWLGWRSWRRKRRLKAGQAGAPDQPWLWDRDWDPAGAVHDPRRDGATAIFGGLWLVLFLAPFHAAFNHLESGAWIWIAAVGLFDVITLIVIGNGFYLLAAGAKYGPSRLRLGAFPFRLGSTLDATLEAPDLVRSLPEARVTLRCVEERWIQRGSNDSADLECLERYCAEQTITPAASGSTWHLSFPIPATAPATELTDITPRYWELEVAADAPGVDYAATFLVPIYAARR